MLNPSHGAILLLDPIPATFMLVFCACANFCFPLFLYIIIVVFEIFQLLKKHVELLNLHCLGQVYVVL